MAAFTGTVGHPPSFAVTLGSKIWVKVFDPTGTLAAEFRVGPFTTPDGLGFVAPAGEAVTFHSAEGAGGGRAGGGVSTRPRW